MWNRPSPAVGSLGVRGEWIGDLRKTLCERARGKKAGIRGKRPLRACWKMLCPGAGGPVNLGMATKWTRIKQQPQVSQRFSRPKLYYIGTFAKIFVYGAIDNRTNLHLSY